MHREVQIPDFLKDAIGESGVLPLNLSSIEPSRMPTIPPYHRMVGRRVTKPAESRLYAPISPRLQARRRFFG
jgi:hypothetical protein